MCSWESEMLGCFSLPVSSTLSLMLPPRGRGGTKDIIVQCAGLVGTAVESAWRQAMVLEGSLFISKEPHVHHSTNVTFRTPSTRLHGRPKVPSSPQVIVTTKYTSGRSFRSHALLMPLWVGS